MKFQLLLITGMLSLTVNAHAEKLFTPTCGPSSRMPWRATSPMSVISCAA